MHLESIFPVVLMGLYMPSCLYSVVLAFARLFPRVMGGDYNSGTKEDQVVYMEIKSMFLDSVACYSQVSQLGTNSISLSASYSSFVGKAVLVEINMVYIERI